MNAHRFCGVLHRSSKVGVDGKFADLDDILQMREVAPI